LITKVVFKKQMKDKKAKKHLTKRALAGER
jgi:hypothetical protein